MKKKELWTIVMVAIVVAIIVAVITATITSNITGNAILKKASLKANSCDADASCEINSGLIKNKLTLIGYSNSTVNSTTGRAYLCVDISGAVSSSPSGC